MSIVPESVKTAHAIGLRRVHQKMKKDETDISRGTTINGVEARICVTSTYDDIFLRVEGEMDGETIFVAVPLDRKMLKKMKADYDWLWGICRNPSLWNRGGQLERAEVVSNPNAKFGV